MELSQIKDKLIGKWSGNNLLRLSWETPSDYFSDSILSVSSIAQDKALMVHYSWSYKDKAQEGTIMLAYDSKQHIVTASWIDSWHMSDKIMYCKGTITEQKIDVLGSYEASPGPDWGWRIILNSISNNELQMLMYNITPDGLEDLAVKADYNRLS